MASWKSRLVDERYGKAMLGDWLFVPAYVAFVAAVLAAVWATGEVEPFSRVETVASTAVGFLGLFIALRLVIHERNKRITEGYFYKTGILEHIERMMNIVSVFYGKSKQRDPSLMTPEELEHRAPPSYSAEETNERKGCALSSWQYHQRLAEMININTFVPAEIRAGVADLLRHGNQSISDYQWNNQPDNWNVVQEFLLEPLSEVIDSDYFRKDGTEKVKDHIQIIEKKRSKIEKRVGLMK